MKKVDYDKIRKLVGEELSRQGLKGDLSYVMVVFGAEEVVTSISIERKLMPEALDILDNVIEGIEQDLVDSDHLDDEVDRISNALYNSELLH